MNDSFKFEDIDSIPIAWINATFDIPDWDSIRRQLNGNPKTVG